MHQDCYVPCTAYHMRGECCCTIHHSYMVVRAVMRSALQYASFNCQGAAFKALESTHQEHGFIHVVQDMSICAGVRIEDMGHKMGCNGVDNGKLWFDGESRDTRATATFAQQGCMHHRCCVMKSLEVSTSSHILLCPTWRHSVNHKCKLFLVARLLWSLLHRDIITCRLPQSC